MIGHAGISAAELVVERRGVAVVRIGLGVSDDGDVAVIAAILAHRRERDWHAEGVKTQHAAVAIGVGDGVGLEDPVVGQRDGGKAEGVGDGRQQERRGVALQSPGGAESVDVRRRLVERRGIAVEQPAGCPDRNLRTVRRSSSWRLSAVFGVRKAAHAWRHGERSARSFRVGF